MFPPLSFVNGLLAAGPATLELNITDTADQRQSIDFDMTGFAETVDYMAQYCPVPVGWEQFETENEDGLVWGYEKYGERIGNLGREQTLYARCYSDNTTFSLVVTSDTPVRRSKDDESVTVAHNLGGSLGQSRWWAVEEDDRMAIYPPNWLVAEFSAAGPVTLILDILDAAGMSQSLQFDMSGYGVAVEASWHTRPPPYEDSDVQLFVRCGQTSGEIDVHFYLHEGHMEAGNGKISPVRHLFLPKEFNDWGAERQSSYIEVNRVDSDWLPERDHRGAFLPEHLYEEFINDIVDFAEVLIMFWNLDGTSVLMAFPLENSYAHIKPVTEECGWTWS